MKRRAFIARLSCVALIGFAGLLKKPTIKGPTPDAVMSFWFESRFSDVNLTRIAAEPGDSVFDPSLIFPHSRSARVT